MMCNHPDIEQFITIKSDLNKLTKANISVKFTDEFFNKVLNDEPFDLSFTRSTGQTITKTINAKELYEKFAQNNFDYAEPGIMYVDRINDWILLSKDPDYKIANGNPCNEAMLPAYGACNLGSFCLSSYVKNHEFDYEEFIKDIPIVVKAMNDILDESVDLLPLQEQRDVVKKWRILGIGIMGLADVFIKLGIKYGSKESIELSDKIGHTLINNVALASANLAKIYGTFDGYNYDYLCESEFYKANIDASTDKIIQSYGLRNAQLLSIAPNGSIGNMIACSGGLEPIYAISYERKTESLHGEPIKYKIYTPIIKELMDKLNITDEKDLPDYVITSQEIPYINRIKVQSIWQSHVDSAISSTINLPNSATVEDIKDIYIQAWKAGLKGVTVYRDGCARQGILTTDKNEAGSDTDAQDSTLKRGEWKPIAEDTIYPKIKLKTGCGELMLFPGWSDKEQSFQEIWIKKIGSGGSERSIEAIAITASALFRTGGSLYNLEKAFKKLEVCPAFTNARKSGKRLSRGNSCADCILKALQKFEADKKQEVIDESIDEVNESVDEKALAPITNACPECGAELISTGGCFTCMACGFSKCG